MNNNKGQSLIETVVILPCLGLLLICFAILVYGGFARAWIGYQMDQALFCLAEGESEFQCKKTVERSMRQFLPFGQVQRFQLSSGNDQWRSEINWEWNQVRLLREKTLKWDSSLWR